VGTANGLLSGDQLNGATLSAHTSPAHGALVLSSDGLFTYKPARGFVGTDSFRYSLSNSAGSSSATVTIDVPARGQLVVSLSAPKVAARGSSFTYTVQVVNAGPDPASGVTTVVDIPIGVTVTGSSLSTSTRSVTWPAPTLAAGTSATYSVAVKVGLAAPGTIVAFATSTSSGSLDPDPLQSTAVALTKT
jgi:uncharacterized repeat protein (TIGR01451 family)